MDTIEVDNKFLNANKKFLEYKNKEIRQLQEEIKEKDKKLKEDKEIISRLIEKQTTADIEELESENQYLQEQLDNKNYKLLEIMSKLPESNFEVKQLSIDSPDYEITIYKETETITIKINDNKLDCIVALVEMAQDRYKGNKT